MESSSSSKPQWHEENLEYAAKLWRGRTPEAEAAAKTAPSSDNVDTILAQEMNQLSVQERNKLFEEIHGVDTFAVEETPELIERSLQKMEAALQEIPSKEAYELAIAMKSSYIHSRDLRLAHLRADLFDPAAAALRMTKHLDLLHYYYGARALQRPLQYNDLSEEDKSFMRHGTYQLLPSRDRSGRLVLFAHSESPRLAVFRAHLYIGTVMMEDIETQRKGHVVVCQQEASMISRISSKADQSKISELVRGFPVRASAVHMCFPDDPIVNLIRPIITLILLGKEERLRLNVYTGLATETRYKLMSFGIPVNEIPVSSTLTIKTKNHRQWIKARMAIEQARNDGKDTSGWIMQPNIHDVLFSPGGNPNNQGNLEFRRMMDSRLREYFSTSKRKAKKTIREELAATARSNGCRFIELNRKGGWWEELKNSDAVDEKISVYFYNQKKKADAMGRLQDESSETYQFLHDSKRQKTDGEGSPCFRC